MHNAEHTEVGGKRGIGSFLSVQDLFTLLNAACGVLAAFCAISGQFALAVLPWTTRAFPAGRRLQNMLIAIAPTRFSTRVARGHLSLELFPAQR